LAQAARLEGAVLQNSGGGGSSKSKRAGKPVKAVDAAAAKDDVGGSPNFIVREVLRGLYRGRFVPGQKLIEADLTRDFGVSRGSVREALNRLAAEGVVTLTLHRGAYIRSLTRAEVVELLSVMEVIVGLAARNAAQRINLPGNRALLDEAYNHLASFKDVSDFLAYIRARNAYYRALIAIGGNRELERVFSGMHVHLVRIQFQGHQQKRPDTRAKDYDRMTAAIRAGAPDRAETLARQHIRQVAEGISSLPAEAFAVDLEQDRAVDRPRAGSGGRMQLPAD
jgi:DNA-binding GntR family transcriptional regulator